MQGLKGLNRGGGYDWETPYLDYLYNLPAEQQDYGQKLFDEYKFAKNYLQEQNINLGEGPIEDYINLFHNIYEQFSPQFQAQQQQPQGDSVIMSLDNIVPDVPEFTQDNLRPLDKSWMEEAMPYIRGEKEVNKQGFAEYIEDVGKKVISGELDLPDNRDFTTVKDIKARAQEISPEWKMAGENSPTSHAGKLKVSNDEWLELGAMYDYLRQTEGQDVADGALQSRLKRMAADQQGFGEQMLYGLGQMGAEAFGSTVSLIGVLGSAITAAPLWAGEKVEGLNGWRNYWANVFNNPLTRYGSDVMKYGTLDPEYAEMLKENGGMSAMQIYRTPEAESGSIAQQIFNWSTIPTLIAQYGFTASAMATGAAEAKVAGALFKGLGKGAAKNATTRGVTREALKASMEGLDKLSKGEKFVYGWVIPGTQAIGEGAIEALDLHDRVYEQGMKDLEEIQSKLYQETLNDYLKSGEAEKIFSGVYRKFHEGQDPKILSIEDELRANPPEGSVEKMIRDQAVQEITEKINAEYQEKYDAAKAQIEAMASRAGVQNLAANVVLLTLTNSTGKIGLANPKTQKVLSQSRLTRWAIPGKNVVNDAGEAVTKYGIAGQVFDVVKEPISEMFEEGAQSVTSDVFGEKANWNIHGFLDNRYNGDAMDEIGKVYQGQHAAALSALGESLASKETWVAAIYGGLSSGMGGLSVGLSSGFSNYRSTNAKGETQWDIFNKRTDSEGNKESTLSYLGRVAPWRSSIAEGIRGVREKKAALEAEAKAMNEWLSDPDNKDKFKNTTASVTWADKLANYAFAGDEFGYRNSNLGKAVNDVFMFAKLRKTNPGLYKSMMDIYEQAANLSEETEAGQKFLDDLNADKSEENKLTAQDVRDNARRFLEIMEKALQEEQSVRQTFGEIDEETRQALVYGRLAIEDFNKRGKQLEEEIGQVLPKTGLKDSVEGTVGLSEQASRVISKYGNTKESLEKAAANLRVEAAQKDEESEKLRRASHKDSKSPDIARERKAQSKKAKQEAKALRKEAKQIDDAIKFYEDLSKTENAIEGKAQKAGTIALSESQILNADPITRAQMLDPKNFNKFSQEQQNVIQRVINAGQQAIGPQFMSKVIDNGKLSEVSQNYISEYSNLISNPNSLKLYTDFHKKEVQAYFAKKQAEAISKISNYTEFSDALDKARFEGTSVQQNTILRVLKDKNPANLERYMRSKSDSEELMSQIRNDEEFKNMYDDQRALMSYAVNYLANNPLEGNKSTRDNIDEAVSKLLEKDSEGNSKFKKYVGSILPEEVSIGDFDFSDENVANLYRQLAEKANKNREELKKLKDSAPVDDSNPSVEPKETIPPKEKKSKLVFDVVNDNGEIESEEDIKAKLQETIDKVNGIINNIGVNEPQLNDKEAKALASAAVQEVISSGETLTANKFLVELSKIKTDYTSPGRSNTELMAGNILDYAITYIMGGYNFYGYELSTLTDVMSWSDNSPVKWIKDFTQKYQIYHFLRTAPFDNKTPIYFYTSEELVNKVKTGMGTTYRPKNDLPVIAVIEVPAGKYDAELTLSINSKDANGQSITRFYRPIGVLPASNNKDYGNAAKLTHIRDLNGSAIRGAGRLLTDDKGRVVVSTGAKVVGTNPSNTGASIEGRNAFNELFIREYLPNGKELIKQLEDLKDDPVAQNKLLQEIFENGEFDKALEDFFDKNIAKGGFHTKKTNEDSNFYSLFYRLDELFTAPKKGFNPQDKFVGITEIGNSLSKNGKQILEAYNSGELDEFNSRTHRYIGRLHKLIKDFSKDVQERKFGVRVNEQGEIQNSIDGINNLNRLSHEDIHSWQQQLEDFIVPSSDVRASYNIVLRQTEDEKQSQNFHYELVLDTNQGQIDLGTIYRSATPNKEITYREVSEILANLLFNDGKTDLRRVGESEKEMSTWGVNYADFTGKSQNADAGKNRMEIVKDNILFMSVNGLVKQPTAVSFILPRGPVVDDKASIKPEVTPTDTSNPDNAKSSEQSEGSGNITKNPATNQVSDDDGVVIEKGTPKKATTPDIVQKLADFAESSNRNVELSDDGTKLLVSGNDVYNVLNKLLGMESNITPKKLKDQLENSSLYVIDTPLTVKGQILINPDGLSTKVQLASEVYLTVRTVLNSQQVGIAIGANKNWTDDQTKELISTLWQFVEEQLGIKLDYAHLAYDYGATMLVDRNYLTTSRANILKAISNQSSNTVVQGDVSQVTEDSKTDAKLAESESPIGDNYESFTILNSPQEDKTQATTEGATKSKFYSSLQTRWGVWDRQDGTHRTEEDIKAIKRKLEEANAGANEAEYYAYFDNLAEQFGLEDATAVLNQEIECFGL